MCVACVTGYTDHVDCLMDVQYGGDSGEKLDCFGIYPHVLPLAVDLVLRENGSTFRQTLPKHTDEELIYWGLNQHLYVLRYLGIDGSNYYYRALHYSAKRGLAISSSSSSSSSSSA